MSRFASLGLRRWEVVFAVALAVFGAGAAVAFSHTVETRYDGTVSVQLESTTLGPTLPERMEAARLDIGSRVMTEPDEQVRFESAPGNPRVLVRATAGTRDRAYRLATEYGVELVALERGIDRLGTFEEIAEIEERLATAGRAATAAERRIERRLRARLQDLRERQVTDSAIRIPSVRRVDGPEPVRNGLLMLPVALLIAAAALRAMRMAGARAAHQPSPDAT